MKNIKDELTKIIEIALKEDEALNDITSDLTIPDNHEIAFDIKSREQIILCGIDAVKICFDILKSTPKFKNSKLQLKILASDGSSVKRSKSIAKGVGNAKLIFAAERIILNTIQHLSGISTLTNKFVKTLNNKKTQILDTRKTTLGLRNLEKYAVVIGGGKNHRLNLSDMVLIKDNHIAASGSIEEAISRAKKNAKGLKIEVECDNLRQVAKAIKSKPDIIMLDNMKPSQIKKAKDIIKNSCKIEISGGINLKNIKKYRNLDVDFISIGAITHSARSVDIGLDVI